MDAHGGHGQAGSGHGYMARLGAGMGAGMGTWALGERSHFWRRAQQADCGCAARLLVSRRAGAWGSGLFRRTCQSRV